MASNDNIVWLMDPSRLLVTNATGRRRVTSLSRHPDIRHSYPSIAISFEDNICSVTTRQTTERRRLKAPALYCITFDVEVLLHAQFGLNISSDILDIGANVYGQFLLKNKRISAFLPYGFNGFMDFCLDGSQEGLLLFLQILLCCLTELLHLLIKFLEFFFATFLDCCRGIGCQLLVLAKLFIELVLQFLELVLVFFAGLVELIIGCRTS